MSGRTITFGTLTSVPFIGAAADRRTVRGRVWRNEDDATLATRILSSQRHGCVVVRRITDDRGREWRVRQLWSENCHGLLFQCAVPGIRSEIRPIQAPLESMTDEDLMFALDLAAE
jgi:hypothetical protein